MKRVLTILMVGLMAGGVIAQEPPKRVTDCDNVEAPTLAKRGLIQQNFPQLNRGLLQSLDINTEQWGRIKAERIKFGRVMKLAGSDLGDSINVILRPEQLKALRERKEIMKQRVKRWRGSKHGAKRHRNKLPKEWEKWHDKAHNDKE